MRTKGLVLWCLVAAMVPDLRGGGDEETSYLVAIYRVDLETTDGLRDNRFFVRDILKVGEDLSVCVRDDVVKAKVMGAVFVGRETETNTCKIICDERQLDCAIWFCTNGVNGTLSLRVREPAWRQGEVYTADNVPFSINGVLCRLPAPRMVGRVDVEGYYVVGVKRQNGSAGGAAKREDRSRKLAEEYQSVPYRDRRTPPGGPAIEPPVHFVPAK